MRRPTPRATFLAAEAGTCVLGRLLGNTGGMGLRLEQILVDANDPEALGRWWAELLGWSFALDPDGDAEVLPPPGVASTGLLFEKVPERKSVKNRLHLDLRPDDQAAEVARAEAMGARRVDVGQGPEVTWVVLADPEGNELCILRSVPPSSEG